MEDMGLELDVGDHVTFGPCLQATPDELLADAPTGTPKVAPASAASNSSCGSLGLEELLHPVARLAVRRCGPVHASLATVLDALLRHRVCVATACGRLYHGTLASVEDASMSLVLEGVLQQKRSGLVALGGPVVLSGDRIVSIYPESSEPQPERDAEVGSLHATASEPEHLLPPAPESAPQLPLHRMHHAHMAALSSAALAGGWRR